ncbi:hypothetical protein GWK47_042831 [Chionoecetes opilio]|uniref:Uncharacterized protein n=1 Tax=Chionoecetes opilio TaxID=41210 RepID=A0A8J4YI00_CHIOP|nr:hypothetical protein GWK47_042831 [Chionoecetes opilio]
MAAATAARYVHHEVWFLGSPNPNPCGGKPFPKTGMCYGPLFPSSVAAEVGERRVSLAPRRGRWWGRKPDPQQKKTAVWRGSPAVRIMGTWIGPRSGALKLTWGNAGVFRRDALFDIGHGGRLRLIRWTRIGVPLGPALPGIPRGISKESTNPLGPPRATASKGRAKAVELTGACHDSTRSHRVWGAGDEEETVGRRGGDRIRSCAGISAKSACSPKRRRTPIMSRLSPLLWTAQGFGPHRSSSFHRCPRHRPHPARSPCGAPGGARGRRWFGK